MSAARRGVPEGGVGGGGGLLKLRRLKPAWMRISLRLGATPFGRQASVRPPTVTLVRGTCCPPELLRRPRCTSLAAPTGACTSSRAGSTPHGPEHSAVEGWRAQPAPVTSRRRTVPCWPATFMSMPAASYFQASLPLKAPGEEAPVRHPATLHFNCCHFACPLTPPKPTCTLLYCSSTPPLCHGR